MIGEEVRRRREELGLTGAQLAANAGMAPSAVSQIETGKRTPSSASVMKLAAAENVEVGELYPKGARQLSLEAIPTFSREDLSEAGLANLEAVLRGEKPSAFIEDTDETVTLRIYYVRLMDENDRLLRKIRELERQNASLTEQLTKAGQQTA